mmetsp:Transcript_2273/g.7443  ORF Transcript_2273/g.7443 Transcript_2273/m.7443 type:complete len:205 (-) Transcript_2273:278-892(-)
MKPRLSHRLIFFLADSAEMPSESDSSERVHLLWAPNRSRMVAWRGVHCTSVTVVSANLTSSVTRPRDGFHTNLRGALIWANCFSNRVISFLTPAGSSNVSCDKCGQQSRETMVASMGAPPPSVAEAPPPSAAEAPRCERMERETRRDSATSVNITSHADSAESPNRFLSISKLRTSFSVSAPALESSLSASIERNSLTKSVFEP